MPGVPGTAGRRADGSTPAACSHPRYHDVFSRRRQRTHITTGPELLLDRMPWNKVFRPGFWDRHELRFSLPLYEDAPVMIRAHVLASKVDVLSQVVYHWRVREAGPLSAWRASLSP